MICFDWFGFAVKSEVKLEERINGMEIKEESSESSKNRLKYPSDLDEFLNRNTSQLFLMQVIQHCYVLPIFKTIATKMRNSLECHFVIAT